jgi:hypothetical protein
MELMKLLKNDIGQTVNSDDAINGAKFIWRIVFNGGYLDFYSLTPMTRDYVSKRYPDAISITALPEMQYRQRVELILLVTDVFCDLPQEDIKEAIFASLNDVEGALICFRDLKRKRDANELMPYLRSDPINKPKETKNENT